MAQVDLEIKSFVQSYIFPWVCVFSMLWYLKTLKENYERKLLKKALSYYDLVAQNHKLQLLSPLHYTVSSDWYLRNKGFIRILEIGVCTGTNLKYYPNNSRVVVADTAYNLKHFFNPIKNRFRNLQFEESVVLDEGNLQNLPDNSVDAVIGFHVLCQARCMMKIVREIHRILAPGGQYYFLEHVHDNRNKDMYYAQRMLSLAKVWPFIFNGCHLDRNPDYIINGLPFRSVRSEYIVMDFPEFSMLKFLGTHLLGYALK